jgi:hypothetical protein
MLAVITISAHGNEEAATLEQMTMEAWKACEAGDGEACFRVSLALDKLPEKPGTKNEMLQRACDGGYKFGCSVLAGQFAFGGGAEDKAKAVPLFQKACDLQDWRSCASLATLYFVGSVVPKDLEKASALFQRACVNGNGAACGALHGLGMSYQSGDGVEQSDAKAAECFKHACAGGHRPACTALQEH